MELLAIAKQREFNFIFGAGNFGIELKEDFILNGIEINGFIVSAGYKNTDFVGGTIVYQDTELVEQTDEVKMNIFIAIYNDQDAIKRQLEAMFGDNTNIIKVSYEDDIAELKSKFMKKYFREKGIDITSNPLVLNGIKLENPFDKNAEYQLSWYVSAVDILIPMLFNDNSYVVDGNYEYGEITLEKEDVVIDCGANIGQFSVIAANKGCEVYAFEPMESMQNYIAANSIYTNNEISIVPYALSDKRGKAIFYEQKGNPLGGTLLAIDSKSKETPIEVDMISLDEFVRDREITKVGFIKADIEGAERDMLRGATEVLQKHEPKLSLCTYHFEDDPQVMKKIIMDANPRYVIIQGENKLYAYVPK